MSYITVYLAQDRKAQKKVGMLLMITLKQLKEEILAYDVIKYEKEDGTLFECVEVILADRIIDLHMDTKEINMGIIAKKILDEGLYVE